MSAIDLVRGDWEQLKLQLPQVKEPIETSATLPPMCYSNDAFFAHELRSEFHKSWIGIGRSDRWRAPCDYAAMEVAGVPIAVLRDEHGVLRAYANVLVAGRDGQHPQARVRGRLQLERIHVWSLTSTITFLMCTLTSSVVFTICPIGPTR